MKISDLKRGAIVLSMTSLLLTTPAYAATLTLDLNGVAGEVYTEGTEGDVTVPDVSADFASANTSYKLKGWNTKRNGSGTTYVSGDKVSEDTTLYAQWASGFMLLVRNTTSLDELIKTAEEIQQDNKSDEAYELLQGAIKDAKAVLNEAANEQEDLDAGLNALKQAIRNFEDSRGNKYYLEALVASAESLQQGDKSDELFKAVQDAISAAKSVLENEQATQAEVDSAMMALEKAVSAFNGVEGDKTFLGILIESADKIAQEKKSDEQYQTLKDVITAAVAVYDKSDATQEEIDAALTALKNALADFDEAKGDKTYLQGLIDKAKTYEQGKKSNEQFKALQDAIALAEKTLANEAAEQGDVDDALEALETAMRVFTEAKGDKTGLKALIESAKNVEQGNKTDEAYAILQSAIAEAEAVLNNADAEQGDVDDALSELKNALANFEESEDISVVEQAKKAASELASKAGSTFDKTGISTIPALIGIGALATGGVGALGYKHYLNKSYNKRKEECLHDE